MTTAILQVDRLCKSFGGVHAVRDLSFAVEPGQILGLIGPNGSGKSTTVNALAGVFPVTSGKIQLAGGHIQALPEYQRVALGLARTFQTASVFPEFTVREQIRLGANVTLRAHPLSAIFGIGQAAFIEFFFHVAVLWLERNLLVREQHEVVNQNLCRLLQCLLGMD